MKNTIYENRWNHNSYNSHLEYFFAISIFRFLLVFFSFIFVSRNLFGYFSLNSWHCLFPFSFQRVLHISKFKQNRICLRVNLRVILFFSFPSLSFSFQCTACFYQEQYEILDDYDVSYVRTCDLFAKKSKKSLEYIFSQFLCLLEAFFT